MQYYYFIAVEQANYLKKFQDTLEAILENMKRQIIILKSLEMNTNNGEYRPNR